MSAHRFLATDSFNHGIITMADVDSSGDGACITVDIYTTLADELDDFVEFTRLGVFSLAEEIYQDHLKEYERFFFVLSQNTPISCSNRVITRSCPKH